MQKQAQETIWRLKRFSIKIVCPIFLAGEEPGGSVCMKRVRDALSRGLFSIATALLLLLKFVAKLQQGHLPEQFLFSFCSNQIEVILPGKSPT